MPPRAKDDKAAKGGAPLAADDETGFAALEAKVEEVQAEAAIEAELDAEDAAFATAVPALQPPSSDLLSSALALAPEPPSAIVAAPPMARSAAPLALTSAVARNAPVTNVGEVFIAAAQLQADTFGRLARARGLQDVVEAQVHYSRGMVDLYVANVTRLLRQFAMPLAPPAGAAASWLSAGLFHWPETAR